MAPYLPPLDPAERLPEEAKEVVGDLREGEWVVFKGDLNYRKLVGDVSVASFSLYSPFNYEPGRKTDANRWPGIRRGGWAAWPGIGA